MCHRVPSGEIILQFLWKTKESDNDTAVYIITSDANHGSENILRDLLFVSTTK
jgi:hypothetical protein